VHHLIKRSEVVHELLFLLLYCSEGHKVAYCDLECLFQGQNRKMRKFDENSINTVFTSAK